MGFRLGFLSGFGAGYYLGARAGRQRYEQINQAVAKARRSPAVEAAAEKARTVVATDDGAGGSTGWKEASVPVPAPDVTPAVAPQTTVVDPDDYSSSR